MIISGSSLGNKIIWTVLGEKTSPGNYIGISLIVVVIRTKPVFYKDGFCFYTWKPGARHPALPIFVICFFDDNLGTSPRIICLEPYLKCSKHIYFYLIVMFRKYG